MGTLKMWWQAQSWVWKMVCLAGWPIVATLLAVLAYPVAGVRGATFGVLLATPLFGVVVWGKVRGWKDQRERREEWKAQNRAALQRVLDTVPVRKTGTGQSVQTITARLVTYVAEAEAGSEYGQPAQAIVYEGQVFSLVKRKEEK